MGFRERTLQSNPHTFFVTYLYVSREFLFSFFVSFLFFFFIFFINQLLLLAEDILSKHVPLLDVLLLVFYSFPLIISLSVPFGSLVGALMAVGRLSSDNEILAFRASGIPRKRIFLPLFALGIILSILSFTVNDYYLPRGTINFLKLYRNLIYSNPEIELQPFSVKRYQDSVIITGDVEERNIKNIIIFDKTEEKDRRIITAGHAYLVESGESDTGVISLQLDDVFLQTSNKRNRNRFEYAVSESMIYNILIKDITFSIRNPGPSEMRSIDVYKIITEKEQSLQKKISDYIRSLDTKLFTLRGEYLSAVDQVYAGEVPFDKILENLGKYSSDYVNSRNKKITDRSLQLYKLEFYKKYAVPFACLIFIIFAFPVGLFTRRSGRSVGFGIGLMISVLYWGMLFAGQTLGLRSGYQPFISMWIPNFFMLILGVFFFLIRMKK